LWADPW